jgi:hypothetical protein
MPKMFWIFRYLSLPSGGVPAPRGPGDHPPPGLGDPGPLLLQDHRYPRPILLQPHGKHGTNLVQVHGHPLRFRHAWVRELRDSSPPGR